MTHFSIRYTEYPTHRQIKLPPGPESFCSKKPNRVPRRRRRSVSQAAQGLLLRPELAFNTLVTSYRPLVRHLLRKIRVSADSERTRRSSRAHAFSHTLFLQLCLYMKHFFPARLARRSPSRVVPGTTPPCSLSRCR